LRISCTSALRSSSKSRAELAAGKVSSKSDFHALSSFIDSFAVFLYDFMNMSLVVTQAMKNLFQFARGSTSALSLKSPALALPHAWQWVFHTLLVRFLVPQMRSCIDPAIQAGRRGLSPHRWSLEPSILFCPRVEHELAQDK
jgi:hypothetical protein